MSTWSNLNFQNANSPMMEQLIMFHDHTMMIILMITITVGYMMFMMMIKSFNNKFMLESQSIELIWTIIPAVLLIFIALPSLKILYMMEETKNPMISIKTIGHQWYWSYEYSDFKKIEFDSYMKIYEGNEHNQFRLLETDNKIIIPKMIQTRMLMTSSDVIHSWTIPVLGIKVDASPGRINQGNMMIQRPGLFFGQCSEICGANHSFMPIMLEVVNMNSFNNWIKKY
uniref:Cytochrome c oxidase subunit 2 n=2 Tax=Hiratettix TaxID=2509927 RepID=A0A9E6XQF2_9HEMI|nr:cytochrome c oxidase subunit II [Hiratettix distanti]YP_010583093.1 cytochrome c oxidase subunit II [Hiratettix malaisei]UGN61525.1 cytochrome c oxidase subunit II [Hiratettix distanti]UGN61539.1 cytochrome c oxidase subunit II [Hiratettix malaisei]